MSHTPGPWDVELDEGHDGAGPRVRGILGPWTVGTTDGSEDIEAEWNATYDTIVRSRRRIVETDGGCYPPRIDDARLIAAAPELLAALKRLLPLAEFRPNELASAADAEEAEWHLEQARLAIEKAEGAD